MTAALDGGVWLASCTCHFTPGERAPGIHLTGGLVEPRASLSAAEKRKILPMPGIGNRTPDLLACSIVLQPVTLLHAPQTFLVFSEMAHHMKTKNKAQ
jgi:hypothetical protein